MHLHDNTLFRRDDPCIPCPSQAPTCQCGIGFQCLTIARGCNACPSTTCVPEAGTSTSSGGGVSKGAVAGGVIGALILLVASICLLLWYRRHQKRQNALIAQVDIKSDTPASADAVLRRPDPVEKPRSPSPSPTEVANAIRIYNANMLSNSTVNDPRAEVLYANGQNTYGRRQSAHGSVQSNPFTDGHSILTTSTSTQSTNVIPIALVPHGSIHSPPHSPASDKVSHASTTPSVPVRPAHSPDLGIRFDPLSAGLNLEHVNMSNDSFRPPNMPYANSQVSGISGFTNRTSMMTTGSFASDVMYEAPQIVTPGAGGAVRQVLGVAKAEVVLAPGSTPQTPMTADSLMPTPSSRLSRPPVRSPLAQTSFGPGDTVNESDVEGQEVVISSHNPFGDEHSPGIFNGTGTPNSTSTFGMPTPVPLPSTASPTRGTYAYPQAPAPSVSPANNNRPISTFTQAASIIDAEITGATLVRLGSASSASTSRSNNRMTSARLVSPSSAPLRVEDDRVLQDQQEQALAAARAYAAANGMPLPSSSSTFSGDTRATGLHRRISDANTLASVGGDSLLESFTFVPPSPISSRPPRSPLSAQQQQGFRGLEAQSARQMQGMSTASAVSTGSALEGYTFHLAGTDSSVPPTPSLPDAHGKIMNQEARFKPSAAANGDGKGLRRQRASLDTLALTADLSAFPLNFDEGRDSFGPSR